MKLWYDRLHEKFASSSLKAAETAEDIERWKQYIAGFQDAKDDIELSYIRYQCRMYYFSPAKKLIMNIFGFGALFAEAYYMLTAKSHDKEAVKGLAVLERARDIPDYSDIVPEEIFDSYEKVITIDNFNKKFGPLCREARSWLLKCMRAHPLQFFYLYFVYMELATHSHILLNYNPEAVFVYINERNIASPILTGLYESENRQFCSFMHGEYRLQMPCAFMRFSRYYIWDNSYREMFSKELRCKIGEYVVYTPKKLRKKWNLEEIEPDYAVSYYFSGDDEETTKNAFLALRKLADHGVKCKIRPHPRDVLHAKLITKLATDNGIDLESASEVSLHDSLARARYIVGLRSTVLAEASVEGRDVVLDDISNREYFETLKAQRFNLFNKKHILFSDLIEELTAKAE